MAGQAKHILLGAGGAISTVLARTLIGHRQAVRLVSRGGFSLPGAESVRADLLDGPATLAAVDPGATVYLVAGLPYRSDVWAEQWPKVMGNTLEACAARGARLIFFDNVYMYGRAAGPMTEDTPINPCSRKGEVRARIAEDLLQAARTGRLKACIARSADFYGPHAGPNSVPNLLVFGPLAAGKRPAWLGNADVPHSLTYTPDCGRALPLLGAAEDVWGRVWHLPTASPALTGRAFVAAAAQQFGAPAGLTALKPWMVGLAGLFDRTRREAVEMIYQSTAPYVFDSTKFERRFGFTPTPYTQGIAATVASYPTAAR